MKKLLVITSRFPFPLDKGDKLRAYHQIKQLSNYYQIQLVCLTDQDVNHKQKEELSKYCHTITVFKLTKLQLLLNLFRALFTKKPIQVAYFYQKKYHKKIKQIIDSFNPDHIYCQLVRCAEYVKDSYGINKTIDYMDTLSKGVERRIPSASKIVRPILRIEANRLKRYENVIYDYFDHHTIISEQDQELVFLENRENIAIIPNGIDINYFEPQKKEKKYNLLFNGNMQYEPNVNSALFIVKEILPLVHKREPNVNLLISGTSPTKEIKQLASDKVEVSGWLSDIRDAYNSAEIFIAPMQIGTGLQNKLLEAMAMELPCITSKLANNALQATPNESILIGQTPQDYADLIIELLNNDKLASDIALSGKKYVQSTFSWEESSKRLYQVMEDHDAHPQKAVN